MRAALRFLLPISIALAACGPPSLKARLINAERRAGEAEDALDEAEKAMAELEPDKAVSHLKRARAKLSDPDVGYYPERGLIGDRLARAEAQVPQVRAERERRDLEQKVNKQRLRVEKVLPAFEKARAVPGAKTLDRDAVDEAEDAIEDLQDVLNDGQALEVKQADYASYAKALRAKLEAVAPGVKLARARLVFAEGPGERRAEAEAIMKRAAAAKAREDRLDLFEDAHEKWVDCSEKGRKRIKENSALAKAAISLQGKTTTPDAVVRLCEKRAVAVAKQVNTLKKQIEKARAQAAKQAKPKKKRR